jgi:hypothetical protein
LGAIARTRARQGVSHRGKENVPFCAIFFGQNYSRELKFLHLLGAGHYLNVDPLGEDRVRYGIGETYFPPPVSGLPVDRWVVAESEKREQIWVNQLVERTTDTGLLICGFWHAFSVAAKLLNRGFEVEARTYTPWNKLAK